MRVRPLFLAVPTALVAVAGLAWLTSAAASNGGFDGVPQIAQATPPAATPPAAGGPAPAAGPERMMRQVLAQVVLRGAHRPADRRPGLSQGQARPQGRPDVGVGRLPEGGRRGERQGEGQVRRAADRDAEDAAELRRPPESSEKTG